MLLLTIGLVLFLGIHLSRTLVPNWRLKMMEEKGEGLWKGIYSAVSLIGLVALIWGYALARDAAAFFYVPVDWGRSVALVAVPIAIWMVIAANFPAGFLKRFMQHPMLWGTVIWSVTHLLMNGDAASVLLFGSFLVWALITLISCYRRPRQNPHAVDPGKGTHWWPDVVSLIIALVLSVALVSFLHEWLFGAAIA
jgi:uncharacterized membrane protein